tara:strand:+ start:180 stop:755 length:576 start_codon:yes stop_codon:yes gene_type:complete
MNNNSNNNNNNNNNNNENLIQSSILENTISNLISQYSMHYHPAPNINNIDNILLNTPILTRNTNSLWSFITDIQNFDSDYTQAIENSMQECTSIKHVLSEKGKQTLKTIVFDNTKHKIKTCPIYRTDFKQNEKITQLPCKHIFDSEAILHWLEHEKAECPVCRTKLPSKELSISKNTTTPPMPLLESHPFF